MLQRPLGRLSGWQLRAGICLDCGRSGRPTGGTGVRGQSEATSVERTKLPGVKPTPMHPLRVSSGVRYRTGARAP